MYAVNFKLKNGKKIGALIWSFKPEDGYLEALDESNGNIKKYNLSDIDEGKVYPDRIRSQYHDTRDLLEWALEEGWQPTE